MINSSFRVRGRHLLGVIMAALIGFGLVTVTASPAAACSCAAPTGDEAPAGADVVTGAYALDLPDGYSPLGAATGESTEFPLLGWLSFVAVAGLGLMPIALWMRLRSRLDQPEPSPQVDPAAGDRRTAPHPFA